MDGVDGNVLAARKNRRHTGPRLTRKVRRKDERENRKLSKALPQISASEYQDVPLEEATGQNEKVHKRRCRQHSDTNQADSNTLSQDFCIGITLHNEPSVVVDEVKLPHEPSSPVNHTNTDVNVAAIGYTCIDSEAVHAKSEAPLQDNHDEYTSIPVLAYDSSVDNIVASKNAIDSGHGHSEGASSLIKNDCSDTTRGNACTCIQDAEDSITKTREHANSAVVGISSQVWKTNWLLLFDDIVDNISEEYFRTDDVPSNDDITCDQTDVIGLSNKAGDITTTSGIEDTIHLKDINNPEDITITHRIECDLSLRETCDSKQQAGCSLICEVSNQGIHDIKELMKVENIHDLVIASNDERNNTPFTQKESESRMKPESHDCSNPVSTSVEDNSQIIIARSQDEHHSIIFDNDQIDDAEVHVHVAGEIDKDIALAISSNSTSDFNLSPENKCAALLDMSSYSSEASDDELVETLFAKSEYPPGMSDDGANLQQGDVDVSFSNYMEAARFLQTQWEQATESADEPMYWTCDEETDETPTHDRNEDIDNDQVIYENSIALKTTKNLEHQYGCRVRNISLDKAGGELSSDTSTMDITTHQMEFIPEQFPNMKRGQKAATCTSPKPAVDSVAVPDTGDECNTVQAEAVCEREMEIKCELVPNLEIGEKYVTISLSKQIVAMFGVPETSGECSTVGAEERYDDDPQPSSVLACLLGKYGNQEVPPSQLTIAGVRTYVQDMVQRLTKSKELAGPAELGLYSGYWGYLFTPGVDMDRLCWMAMAQEGGCALSEIYTKVGKGRKIRMVRKKERI